MKKICYVISSLKKLGPVIVLYNIIKNLDRTRFEPYIVTLSKESQNSLLQDFQNLKIDVIQLNLKRTNSFLIGPFKLRENINKIKPDIVHSHCFRSSIFSAISLRGYKKITTIHCDYKTDYMMSYGNTLGYLMFLALNFALKKIKKNICCSKQLADILRGRNKNIKFNYIDNGVDSDFFKPMKNKTEMREKLNLPIDKKIFIWCGNIIEVKSPITIVNAIKQVKNENLFFIICGNGTQEKECKEKLMNNNNVLFTGYVDNIKEYLQASDYYISTSLSEGLPNGVLEALSCGLPCILSDISQHKYILEKNKYSGIFFKVQDAKDLVSKIDNILHENYNLYSENTIKLIKENFSAKLMSEKYSRIYE